MTPTSNPLDAMISVFPRADNADDVRNFPMREVLQRVRDGTYSKKIVRVREVLATKGARAYRQQKKNLEAFITAGRFSRRENAAMLESSGALVLDYDHVADVTALRAAVKADAHVIFSFVSPSGDGLKVGVRVPPCANDAEHKRAWAAAAKYSAEHWGVEAKADAQCKDVSRLCFVSHDPELFINENAASLDVSSEPQTSEPSEYPAKYESKPIDNGGTSGDRDKALAALARLASWRVDPYSAWINVGMALKAVSHDLLPEWERWSQASAKFKPGECLEKWESFKRNGLGLGSLIHWANEDDPNGKPKAKRKPQSKRGDGDTRPELKVRDDDLSVLIDETWAALRDYNNASPRLFRFGGIVADVAKDARGELSIRPLSQPAMREVLARAAWWFKLRKETDGETGDASFTKIPTKAPGELAAVMLATPGATLPVLNRIVRAPMLSASGRIHSANGYDADSCCWFALGGLTLPGVSSNPTPDEIKTAREMFTDELLGDFPFVGAGDRANCLAMFLLPFMREMIDGPTPLHLIEKPLPGSGASLIAEALALVTRGTSAGFMTEGSDDDEWRKRITSTLLKGQEIIVVDNVSRELNSGALSSALTAHVWEDRLLGRTEMLTLPIRCVWLATGNNPTTSSEIARRIVPIRIDPKVDNPTERTNFRHPKLLAWVRDNRAALVQAALTLASAWLAAGKPEGRANLASFERWASVMGGLLGVAGVPGFLCNRTTFTSRADVQGELTRGFIKAWANYRQNEPTGAGELADFAEDLDFGNCTPEARRIRLGKFVRGLVGRVFTVEGVKLQVERAGDRNGSALYRLTAGEGESGE